MTGRFTSIHMLDSVYTLIGNHVAFPFQKQKIAKRIREERGVLRRNRIEKKKGRKGTLSNTLLDYSWNTRFSYESLRDHQSSPIDQRKRTYLVDVRKNTTTSDSRSDKKIQLLVTTDSKLKMSWCNTLYTEILRGVTYHRQQYDSITDSGRPTRELEDFSGEVLHDGGYVYSGFGTDSNIVCVLASKETR